MIIFCKLLGSTKKVTFAWLSFLSYTFKIIISLIKQFKTHDVSTCLKEIVLLHSLCLYEHQSYSYSPSPRNARGVRVKVYLGIMTVWTSAATREQAYKARGEKDREGGKKVYTRVYKVFKIHICIVRLMRLEVHQLFPHLIGM